MDTQRLLSLGLTVKPSGSGTDVELELSLLPIVNPLTRKPIQRVAFTVVGDRLIAIDPPELVGIAPVPIGALETVADLESQISTAFNEHIFHVQRRSSELQALGLSPRVDPQTLELSCRISGEGCEFAIASDKRGNFRVVKAAKNGVEVDTSAGHVFELSEFREKSALVGYLMAMFGDVAAAPEPQSAQTPGPVRYREVFERIGGGAMVPPASTVDVLVELEVNGERLRFAAARIAERTFRGLLAGASGKLWAERFELDDFPGAKALVAEVVGVPIEQVRIIGEEE